MKILDRVAEQQQTVQRELEQITKIKLFLDSLPAGVVNDLPEGYVFNGQIDFDQLPHSEVIRVIRLFAAGKWTKTPGDDAKIHYETELNGIKIRCYSGEPPPNCKIVEETHTIPAQPERTVTRRRLVCQETVQVESEVGA